MTICNDICHGIENLGNTCYASTALICLFSCKAFVENLSRSNGIVAKNLYELYTTLRVSSGNPRQLYALLREKFASHIYLYEQNDVMELITILIHLLYEEETQFSTPQHKKGKKNYKSPLLSLKEKMEDAWQNTHKHIVTNTVRIFFGQNVLQLKCNNCQHLEHIGEVFLSVSVPIENDTSNSLEHMINKSFSCECVERTCEKCRKQSAKRSCRIWRLPQYLIIHLKRFDYTNRKIQCKVNVPYTIDLYNNYIFEDNSQYRLNAICCHQGNTGYGHYFAIVKNDNVENKWTVFDDDTPPRDIVSYQDIDSLYYYVLFFTKII